jgi:hypothetical protein
MDKYVSELELNQKAVAPRVTEEALLANIVDERYFSAHEGVVGERFVHGAGESDAGEGAIPEALKLTTYCVLTLKNGFTVTGMSACASPENYDPSIGQRVARGDAIRQVWPLMGYELRSQLAGFTNCVVPDEQIARLVHEANRVFCEYLGDTSQPIWDEAPDWQKASAIDGVRFHRNHPDADDSASHENWMKAKLADGWQYGPTKLPDQKQHPCMVPFNELPADQQFKDRLFRTLVHAALRG